jgi:beta-glucosidase
VLMPWVNDVAAVLLSWLPGQAMGDALADVLFGRAEPGGRLPVTLPRVERDCPVLHAEPAAAGLLEYSEGLLVGYRGYDAAGIEPLFEFGHGLGYTTWEYDSLRVIAGGPHSGGDVDLAVVVRNTGSRPGREVVQAYLAGPQDDATRPLRVLAAFGIASAPPGGTAEVLLRIPARAFARWDTELGTWAWPGGEFTIAVGRSSRDLRLSESVRSG